MKEALKNNSNATQEGTVVKQSPLKAKPKDDKLQEMRKTQSIDSKP